MTNLNAFDIVGASGIANPDALFAALHAFTGDALKRLGKGHPLYQYHQFYSGIFSRSSDVLAGGALAYSAVHQVS
jgi:hypothetical protein